MWEVTARRILVIFAIFTLLITILSPVQAVPAWSRRTGLACMSCHVGGSSRLNALGRDFQQRGHRLRGEGEGLARGYALLDYTTFAAKFRHSQQNQGQDSSRIQTSSVLSGGPLSPRLSYFAEYLVYDRLATGSADSGLMDAYVQYVSSPDTAQFWWARAGNLYPYAVYMMGGGGRVPLSRPRLITDRPGGAAPALMRRAVGISTGFSGGAGWQFEGGLTRAEGDGGAESFLTVEYAPDPSGSAVGLIGRNGRVASNGSSSPYSQSGLLARWTDGKYTLSGAYLKTWGRDPSGIPRQPDGYYLEASANVLAETTTFLRYDTVPTTRVGVSRSHTLTGGVTQRIPGTGRVVFEVGDFQVGSVRQRTFQVDLLLMY